MAQAGQAMNQTSWAGSPHPQVSAAAGWPDQTCHHRTHGGHGEAGEGHEVEADGAQDPRAARRVDAASSSRDPPLPAPAGGSASSRWLGAPAADRVGRRMRRHLHPARHRRRAYRRAPAATRSTRRRSYDRRPCPTTAVASWSGPGCSASPPRVGPDPPGLAGARPRGGRRARPRAFAAPRATRASSVSAIPSRTTSRWPCWPARAGADLEAATGRRLLHVTGQVTLGRRSDAGAPSPARWHAAGAPVEQCPGRARRRGACPGIAATGTVLVEPDSGVLAADDCLRRAARGRRLRAYATRLHRCTRSRQRPARSPSDGRRHRAAGRHRRRLCRPGHASGSLGVPARAAVAAARRCPRWPTSAAQPGAAVTAARLHRMGRRHGLRPARPGRRPARRDLQGVPSHAGPGPRRLRSDRPRPARRRRPCAPRPADRRGGAPAPLARPASPWPRSVASTTTPPTPTSCSTGSGGVVVGCGTSGHAFKFGPLLGELLADLAEGATPSVDLSRFSLRPTRHAAADGSSVRRGPVGCAHAPLCRPAPERQRRRPRPPRHGRAAGLLRRPGLHAMSRRTSRRATSSSRRDPRARPASPPPLSSVWPRTSATRPPCSSAAWPTSSASGSSSPYAKAGADPARHHVTFLATAPLEGCARRVRPPEERPRRARRRRQGGLRAHAGRLCQHEVHRARSWSAASASSARPGTGTRSPSSAPSRKR